MQYLAFSLTIIKVFAYLVGRDVLVMTDAPGKSLFDFKRWPHGRQGCEYFGLGLHVVVSRLRMPPPENRT